MLSSYDGEHGPTESKTFTLCPLTGKCTKDQIPEVSTGTVQLFQVRQRWKQAKGTWEGAERESIKQKHNQETTVSEKPRKKAKVDKCTEYWPLSLVVEQYSEQIHGMMSWHSSSQGKTGGPLLMSANFHGVETPNFKLPMVCQLTHKIPECLLTGSCWPIAGALASGGWRAGDLDQDIWRRGECEDSTYRRVRNKVWDSSKNVRVGWILMQVKQRPKLEITVEYIIVSSSLNPRVTEILASVRTAYIFKIKGSYFLEYINSFLKW